MAQMTITIPNAVLTRVVTALCTQAGTSISAANAKAEAINMIKRAVKAYETAQAGQAALATASQSVDTDIVLS